MDEDPRNERLRLRFVSRAEAPILRSRYAHEPGGFNDFGQAATEAPAAAEHAIQASRGQLPSGELRDEHSGVLWVEVLGGGGPIGTVEYHRVMYGPNAESAGWMIGIDLRPEGRGQGYGAEAQRLLADWLFQTTSANRVEAQTDIDNLAEARALETAGFTREGVLRGAQFRAGAYHDLVVYSRLREESEKIERS
jgi:RimJ/RimL family protein N-acetyltransferase